MSDTDILVIQLENGQPINYPLTYNNFLLLFPECPVEENPTNDVIGEYGYNLFTMTPTPHFGVGPYVQKEDGTWTNTWVRIN